MRCPFDGTELSALIGDVLGDRYRVLTLLGEGAMGDVYLAEHVLLGKRMAVKVLKHAFSQNVEFVRRFQQEAVASSRIVHENIVSITDFGRTPDGLLYFVMEALDGKNLSTLLEGGKRFPVERALPILIQVSRALGAAHAQGIVHRDLKSDNVMIVPRDDGSELAKVLDFGISKVPTGEHEANAERLTQAGIVMGTPTYMSPEQARGERVDARADIYSFGVLTYELVTGTLPFEGGNVAGVLMRHLSERPQPPTERCPESQLPARLEALILHMLEKDAAHRPQAMDAVRDELTAIAQAIGGLKTPASAQLAPSVYGGATSAAPGSNGAPARRGFAPTLLSSRDRSPQAFGPPGRDPGQNHAVRVRAPASAEDAARPVPIPLTSPVRPSANAAHAPAANAQTPAAPDRAPRRRGGMLAVLLLVLAAGGGGVFAGWRLRHRSPVPVVTPPPAAPSVPAPSLPAPAPVVLPPPPQEAAHPVAPPANPPHTEAAAAPSESSDPSASAPVRPVHRVRPHLRKDDVTPVFVRSQVKLRGCLTHHRALLPGKQGQLLLSFTVARSGEVREAHLGGALVHSALERCIVDEVKRMRFPRHTGADDSFDQPFKYDFKD